MSANGVGRMASRGGFTLVEVAVSILLAVIVVTAAMLARYNSVRQARRADAYNGAGRLALLLLEGWRSYAAPTDYNPVANFGSSSAVHMTISTSGTGPSAPDFDQVLGRYLVVLDHANYYVTLAYTEKTTGHPAKLHAAVAFRSQYDTGSVSDSANIVRLTTYD
jgi:type II secretory pathway pseudopilin PulG